MLDIKYFKEKLEKELALLESELQSVARRNPDNPKDWQPVPAEYETAPQEPVDQADSIEEFETNTAITKQLEIRYQEVKDALARIAGGTYGLCRVSGDAIEIERLEANPAAATCITHKDS